MRNLMKRWLLLVMLSAAAILATACAQATPEPVIFTVEMSEYAFTPNTLEVEVGQQVTINLINKGVLEHEIMFGKNVAMMNNLPNGYDEDLFELAGVEPEVMMAEGDMGGEGTHAEEESEEHGEEEEHGHSGFMVLLPKTGDEASMTFVVTKEMVGEWEMGCFLLDGVHYTSGMVGKLIVNP